MSIFSSLTICINDKRRFLFLSFAASWWAICSLSSSSSTRRRPLCNHPHHHPKTHLFQQVPHTTHSNHHLTSLSTGSYLYCNDNAIGLWLKCVFNKTKQPIQHLINLHIF
jgi:hypothetical protein